MSGIVDVHCHVLPGVDDGAPDVATSLEFLRQAHAAGTSDIIATSHQHAGRYPNEAGALRRAHDVLLEARERAVAAGEELPAVHLGAEVHLDGDIAAAVAAGERLVLAGGPYLLLELPDAFPLKAVEDLIFRLHLAGIVTLLAHPERVGQLLRHPEQLRRLVGLGALGQLTGSSIAGDFGRPCREASERLLKDGLVHVVASDAHDLKRRPPKLDRARAAVEDLLGTEAAIDLLERRPRAVLEGRRFDVPPPAEPAPEPAGWPRRLRARLGW